MEVLYFNYMFVFSFIFNLFGFFFVFWFYYLVNRIESFYGIRYLIIE